MKKVTLKKLSVENYKKFEAREFDFAGRTEVSGRNRQGKTSLMDAYFDVLTGKLADGTLPNNIRRKVDGEEVNDPVVRELVIDVDGMEYVVQKKTKKGKSSNTVEYYVNGIKRNKTEYMEILKRIADPDTIAMCSNARVFLNEIQKATAKARETLGGIAGFSESQFRAEHPEYAWMKNEGVEGDSIEEILKARRRDLRKAKSDVDDIVKQIRKQKQRERQKLAIEQDMSRDSSRDVTQQNKIKNKKEELDKEKDNNLIVSKDTIRQTDVRRVIEEWNKLQDVGIAPIRDIKPASKRGQMLKGRIREYGMDDLLKAMDNIRHSDFLRGENKNGWMITFDWFVKPNNFLKVLEGNYNGDRKHGSGAKTQRKVEPLIPFGTLGDDGNSDTLPFMR